MRKSIKRLTAAVLFMSITVSSTFFLLRVKIMMFLQKIR